MSAFAKSTHGVAYLCGLVAAIIVIVAITRIQMRTLAYHTIPQPLWQSSSYSTPLASADGVVLAIANANPDSSPDGIVGLDAATGALGWRLYDASFVSVDATQTRVLYTGTSSAGSSDDTVVGMVDAANGLLHWKFALPSGMATSASSVILTDTRCFIFATSTATNTTSPDFNRHAAYILDPRTGRQIGGYSLPTTLNFNGTPLIDGTTLYAEEPGDVTGPTQDTTTVHAFNALTGKPLWQTEVRNTQDFVAADGALFVTTGNPIATTSAPNSSWATLALDGATGKQRWSFALHAYSVPPIVAAHAVYIYSGNSGNSLISTLDPATGQMLWQTHLQPFTTEGRSAHIVVADGVLYLGQFGLRTIALDAATGRELWQSPVSSSFFTLDGSFIAARVDTYLVLISIQDGSVVWDWYSQILGDAPVAANGEVFVETTAGLTALSEQE